MLRQNGVPKGLGLGFTGMLGRLMYPKLGFVKLAVHTKINMKPGFLNPHLSPTEAEESTSPCTVQHDSRTRSREVDWYGFRAEVSYGIPFRSPKPSTVAAGHSQGKNALGLARLGSSKPEP